MYWPLMKNPISFYDRIKMAKFLLFSNKFTNGPKVKEFEEKWSDWLGVKNSLYVSSGSCANLLLFSAIKELYKIKDGEKVLVPACTWTTSISPVIQSGLVPIFCDINLKNFSFNENNLNYIKKIHPDIKIIFITHLLGILANKQICESLFPNALIIEDLCESHGLENEEGKKVGSESLGATFSFYFGHHINTIEGGMVSTNNDELYNLLRMKRSHGLAREATYEKFGEYAEKNPKISRQFLFMTDGYNFRNHEVCAVLGLSQLKRLNKIIETRRKNYHQFHNIISKNKNKFYIPDCKKGNSSFCLPIICKNKSLATKLKKILEEKKIEYRPIVSGNILKHPAFKKYKLCTNKTKLTVDILHRNGLYIGNNQFVTKDQINELSKILNGI
jgi:CDP-6-deoxy-D-xylo-4-hexulose-3-dehydrase